jgi:hypothetical protein
MPFIDWFVIALICFWTIMTLFSCLLKLVGFAEDSDLSILKPFTPFIEKMLTWRRKLHRYDHTVKLLPSWYLFSGDEWHDIQVYVRGLCSDFSFTGWENITPKGRDGAICLSFPTKYETRAVRKMALSISPKNRAAFGAGEDGDMTGQAANQKEGTGSGPVDEIKAITHRIPYQFVLQYVRQHSLDPEVQQFQFLIASSNDVPDDWKIETPAHFTVPDCSVLFVSPFHKTLRQVPVTPDRLPVEQKESDKLPMAKQPVVA